MAEDLNSNLDDTNQDRTEPQEQVSGKPVQPSRTPFFKDLLSRRVPQILGGYLAASWIILEFIDWLVSRFSISPHLVLFCLVALAAMIPTVFLVAYFHGKPGRDQWTRVEKIGIPTNLAGTAILLIFLFQGKDLGATTTSVSVTNEMGQQIERVIPKSDFRKKVAIFSLENETGDTTFDWMMHAIPDMIKLDLIQDMYLDIKSVYDFFENVRDEGFPDAIGIPLILKKKIAEQQYMDSFIAGTIHQQDDQLSVMVILHETRTTKSLAENTFAGKDILKMVDEISIWVKEALSLPEQQLASTVDLPVKEILTKSAQALKTFYSGMNEYHILENREKGLTLFGQSTKQDSTFAYAYREVIGASIMNTRSEELMQAFQPLMKYLYKLPERMQFKSKYGYYFIVKKDADMALRVVKSWGELYPGDVNAHRLLALLYRDRDQRDEAVAAYEQILSLDPGLYDHLLDIADIRKSQGKFEESLEYYQRYAEALPNSAISYIMLGFFHASIGKHEQAIPYYERALLMEPDDISILLQLANIKTEMGDFISALDDYEGILDKCDSPQEKVQVYQSLENYFFLRGQVNKAIEYIERRLTEQEKYDTQLNILLTRFNSLERYILAGRVNTAFQVAREMEENLGPPNDQLIPWAYLRIYLELEQAREIKEYVELVDAYIDTTQMEANRPGTFWARGKLLEINQDYETAIQLYLKRHEAYPANVFMNFHIGRCYRMNRQYKKAEEHFQKIIDIHPFWPEELYEFGLVYAEWGKHDKALEYVRRANSIWEDADTTYNLAMRAREKLAELEASSP
jgi:tetratricopeptide (TPR) repeat protein